jgi:hypothetical protein
MAKYDLVLVHYKGDDSDLNMLERVEDVDDDMIVVASGGFTLEQLAGHCDGQAENRNAHNYVNAHKVLAGLLHRTLGRDPATNVMLGIAQRGGLDGMNGMGGEPDSFEEFGLTGDGNFYDWKLSDNPA